MHHHKLFARLLTSAYISHELVDVSAREAEGAGGLVFDATELVMGLAESNATSVRVALVLSRFGRDKAGKQKDLAAVKVRLIDLGSKCRSCVATPPS